MSSPEQTPNKCFFCPFSFEGVSPDIEKVHLDDHFDMLNLDLSLLRYDKVIHDLENVLKETTCLCCAAKFQKEGDMLKHLKDKHREFNLICKFVRCPFVTNEKSLLNIHERNHLFRYKCDVCNEISFQSLLLRDRHFVHSHTLRDVCRVCKKMVDHKAIKRHELLCILKRIQNLHSTDSNITFGYGEATSDHKCCFCPFVDYSEENFRKHLSDHYKQMQKHLQTSSRCDAVTSENEDNQRMTANNSPMTDFSAQNHAEETHNHYQLQPGFVELPVENRKRPRTSAAVGSHTVNSTMVFPDFPAQSYAGETHNHYQLQPGLVELPVENHQRPRTYSAVGSHTVNSTMVFPDFPAQSYAGETHNHYQLQPGLVELPVENHQRPRTSSAVGSHTVNSTMVFPDFPAQSYAGETHNHYQLQPGLVELPVENHQRPRTSSAVGSHTVNSTMVFPDFPAQSYAGETHNHYQLQPGLVELPVENHQRPRTSSAVGSHTVNSRMVFPDFPAQSYAGETHNRYRMVAGIQNLFSYSSIQRVNIPGGRHIYFRSQEVMLSNDAQEQTSEE